MRERIKSRRLAAFWLAVICVLGCGKAAPKPGSFKRAPEPDYPVQAANQAGAATPSPTPAGTPQQAAAAAPGVAPTTATPNPVVAPSRPAATSIKVEPIDAAWPNEKKFEQTEARLKQLALAIREYAIKEGRFPAAPGQKLSWRVLLLPYLGHAEQFAKFNLQEPWDSPANVEAAKEVPQVYQSPWRSDSLTCFLAPLGPNTVLASPTGVDAARLNDKWSSIIELLMVDDEFAIPWSKPADFVLSTSGPPTGSLGRDRGGFLVALADGEVRWVPPSVRGDALSALMTIGGDEYARAAVLTQGAQDGLPLMSLAASSSKAASAVADAGSASGDGSAGPGSSRPPSLTLPGPTDHDARIPQPDEGETEKARVLLRQVFKEEIEKTKKGDKARSKHDLAQELIKSEQKVEGEPAAHFVLLQTARDNAAAVGDFKLAQQATNRLTALYQVDDLDLRRRTVTESAQALLPYYQDQSEELRKECEAVLKLAMQSDDFAAAKELLAVYTETTRRRKPERSDANAYRMELQRLQAAEKEIDDMKKSYQKVPAALKALAQTPDDPEANYTLGAYLCLVKLRWLDGAKHLAKGSNLRLKVLATEDQAPPVGPLGMVSLANEYWTLSEQETGLNKRGLQLRAVYWYRLALPNLPAGLAKVQAERRSQEADKTYGERLVKEALSMMEPGGESQSVAQGTD